MKTLEEIEAVIAKLDQQIPLLVEQRAMARGYRQAILERDEFPSDNDLDELKQRPIVNPKKQLTGEDEVTKPDLKVAESKKA